ncbi:MAG: TrmH family RNA methyltransferase [Flavobacterium sp.]|nr:MAG: TrmH family RNA methyltransferase [Flavobacterium sp.]
MLQLTHSSTPFVKREFPIVLICDGVKGPANIGSIFRIAEGFGVREIVFGKADIDFDSGRLKKTARDTHRKVSYTQSDDLRMTVNHFKREGYFIAALEITDNSKPLHDLRWIGTDKLALILGNEAHGISEEILELTDKAYHIELYGDNSSINVAQAAAVALYHLTAAK